MRPQAGSEWERYCFARDPRLGPSTSKSTSRLCARDIRGFLLETFETLATAHCCDLAQRGRNNKASVVLSPAQRRTVSTHGLNLRYSTVPLSEPTPACDSVRGQNDAGYVGSSNIWNQTPLPAQSSAIDIPMASMSSSKVDGWWGEKKFKGTRRSKTAVGSSVTIPGEGFYEPSLTRIDWLFWLGSA